MLGSTTAGRQSKRAVPLAAVLSVAVSCVAPLAAAHAAERELTDVAERAVRSVVNISSTKLPAAPRREDLLPFFGDPFFRHFFGPHFAPRVPPDRRLRSLGSGVIVTADGVVLTNNHVVDGAERVRVTLSDGSAFDAKVLGSDPQSDVAVLRILEASDPLEPLPFGDSDALRLAETVLAIGNPFGVGQTVTMGIVSAVGRANVGIVDYEDFIQTDAAINPGNSGGALLNTRGELIGINTAIVSRSGGYNGVGFAIPSNMARAIMDSLVEHGRVVRGWLGVTIQEVDEDLAEALGVDEAAGVLISDVRDDSPAADAGLKPGDVIVGLNGEKMRSSGDLRNRIAMSGSGTEIDLDIVRDGEPSSVRVTLGERPGATDEAPPPSGDGEETLAGLDLVTLNERSRARFRIPDEVDKGVVVADVADGSDAAETGLRPGDVIVQIDRRDVDSPRRFAEIFSEAGERVLLLVVRGADTRFVVLKK